MAGMVTGEMGGSPIFLENAASEATLEALLQATLANNPNKGKAAQIQKAYEDAVKKSTDRQIGNTDSLRKQTEAIAKEEKQRNDLNKKLQDESEARKKLGSALEEVGQVLGKGLGAALSTATPKVSDFTNALGGIPVLGPIIAALGSSVQNSIDSFRSLSSVGADFGVGVLELGVESGKAGLSLDTFSKAIISNSSDLASLGGNAAMGAKMFQQVNASMKGAFRDNLSSLGFSMEETAEFTAGYLSMQTRLGKAQRMTQDDLNEGTQGYLLELDKLARVTGVSRSEMQKKIDAEMQDDRMKALSMKLGAFGDELLSTIAGVSSKSKETAEGLKDLMLTNGAPITEFGQSIMSQFPALAASAVAYKNQKIGLDAFHQALRDAGAGANNLLRSTGDTIGLNKGLGVTIQGASMKLGVFENYAKEGAAAINAHNEASKKAADALLKLDSDLLEMRNSIMTALLPTLQMFSSVLIANIPLIRDFALTVSHGILDFIRTMNDPDKGFAVAVTESLSGIGKVAGPILADVLSETFKTLFSSNAVITGTVMAITALFVGSKVIGAMSALGAISGLLKGSSTGPAPGSLAGWKGGANPTGPSSPVGGGGPGAKGFGLTALLGFGGGMAADALKDAGHTKTGAWTDMLSQTATYAGSGALLGSMFGPLGTAIGGVGGGVLGAGMGIYQNWGNFFGGGDKKPATAASGDMNTAAMVAQTVTSEEVKALAAALKDLDYSKLAIKPEVLASIDSGALKMRQLRGEVNAITKSFKALDDTGLDKITKGINRLSEEFENFNNRFSVDFMNVFKKLDRASQEALLTDLNEKIDVLNTSTQRLIEIEEKVEENTKAISNKTGTNMVKK